jgi:soluble lytic murein transglycosylase
VEKVRRRLASGGYTLPPTGERRRAFLVVSLEPTARLGLWLSLSLLLLACAVRPVGMFLHPLRYREALCAQARLNHLSPSLVAALVLHESSYDPSARSRVGAVGLMQLMPETARDLGGGADLLDPDTNLRLGTRYLGQMRDRFGDSPIDYLAAYNAGPENVAHWQAEHCTDHLTLEQIPFGETRRYVRSVLACQTCYQGLYSL